MPRNIQLSCLTTVIFFWTVQGVFIHNCNNYTQVILENTRVVLSCGNISETVKNDWCDFKMNQITSCNSRGNCTKNKNLDYQFIRNSTWSQLVIPRGLNRSDPKRTFTCRANGLKYTCHLVIKSDDFQTTQYIDILSAPFAPSAELETFKVAAIVVASGIAAGILIIGIVVLIKRKGDIYNKPTQMNLDEHPYSIILASQRANTRGSVQENELRPFYVNVCRNGNPRS